jgi:hypothetical protein
MNKAPPQSYFSVNKTTLKSHLNIARQIQSAEIQRIADNLLQVKKSGLWAAKSTLK